MADTAPPSCDDCARCETRCDCPGCVAPSAAAPVSYTDTDVELVALALADACPTPDQCADTHDECMRRHGVHWTALGVGGVGPQSITEIEGSPTVIARIALSALAAAGYQVLPPGGTTRVERRALGTDLHMSRRTVWVGPWQPDTEESTE